jgi:outer membrane protein
MRLANLFSNSPLLIAGFALAILAAPSARSQSPGETAIHQQPAQLPSQQSAPPNTQLTLERARQIAVANHPQLRASQFAANEAHDATTEARSAYYPTVSADLTGVGSNDARIAAGGLNNPIVYDRFAAGVSVDQLVTDFGRTRNLVSSAKFHGQAADQDVNLTREQVLLNLDRAFYAALSAQAVLNVAQETVKNRQVVDDQISALAQSNLRSTLDVSFADVNLAQAKMILIQAQNGLESSQAELSAALGMPKMQLYVLTDPGTPSEPLPSLEDSIATALRHRPDVASQRLEGQSQQRFAVAERDLWMPDVTLEGVAGEAPYAQSQIPQNYGAIGFDVHIPIFNGKLFNARHAAAQDRARESAEQLRDLEDNVARDVRIAWLAANTAYQNLALTAQFFDAAQKALDLATERYKLGLSSIVELSQAQLNQEQASIAQASAKYGYSVRVSELMYQEGALKN